MIVLAIIMLWCFHHRIEGNSRNKNRLKWVEVQDYFETTFKLTRAQSKLNFRILDEHISNSKYGGNLYDKLWYDRRSEKYKGDLQKGIKIQFSNDDTEQ